MTSMALASLTETYTDSEGEESAPRDSFEKPEEVVKKIEIPVHKPVTGRPTRLVSYHGHDDTVVSDDENSEMRIIESPAFENPPQVEEKKLAVDFTDVDMPPEPNGHCPAELSDKIIEMTKKMNERGYDMNLIIQKRKTFRNPSIYEKLIDFCNINEFGTNYEPNIYDPLKWDKTSYYDELAKLQKADMEQREKERRERTKIEVLTGTAKKVSNGNVQTEDESKKRKSKWDQVVYPAQVAARVPPGVTTLTTAVTGTKGIVISAFGSLPKKPKS